MYINFIYSGGAEGIYRGAKAKEFLRYQWEHRERLAAEGRTLVHYWSSSTNGDTLVFNGQPEVEKLARNEKPIHLCPFINHCREGETDHNVQAVHIRVSRCFCFKSLLIFHIVTSQSHSKCLPRLHHHQESSRGEVLARSLQAQQ